MKNSALKNKFLLLALLTTLAAIGVHLYLTQHFYALKFGTQEGPSVCNVSETMNCDVVTASSYSALFGIPIALWGMATNLVLLYFLAVTRWNLTQDRAQTSRYAFLFSLVTVIASVVMGIISFTKIGSVCLFCISAYVLSVIGFIGAWLGAEDLSASNIVEDIKDVFVSQRWVLGFAIAIPVIAFLGNIMYLESHGMSEVDKLAKEKVAYWNVAPQQTFDQTTGLIMQKGSGEPVMTIVEFADFRCGHCKSAAAPIHSFVNSHPDVRLIYKPFPLDGTCNEALGGRGDGISCGLAFAAMCAEKNWQKGWAAHDYIFDKQTEIVQAGNLDKNLEEIATHIQAPLEDLKKCVASPEIRELVSKMAKEGENAKIQGTPTIFVNGRVLDRGQVIPVLEAAYKSLK
ncbi:vitamin K epoxide reductase family protein [Bdellovibrio sp. HCB2-146]|uniref:vitamin K epoxide reductase/DsbA family protein n=1 Tax=Bdellovibrio sp. HCB2-146 TaxID=3394362 RepID=UPI0039BCAAFC